MKNDSPMSIPLVSFSSKWQGRESDHEMGKNIFQSDNYIRISPTRKLPGVCYAVSIESVSRLPLLPEGAVAVFSKTDRDALSNIYAVGVQEGGPFVGKWMQKESSEGNTNSRRKVFMVPTPMHIPDSQVSPIAPSLHQVLLFKELAGSGKLRLISASKVLWKHPLVYVHKT